MKIYLLMLSAIVTSCTALKYAMDEKIIVKKNCAILSGSNLPLIDVEIEGKNLPFILDTGAMGSVLFDSTAIGNFDSKKLAGLGSRYSADKKKAKNRFMTAKVVTKLFESENKLMTFSIFPESKCNKSTMKGILGLDAFFEDKTVMFLNFSNNEVCNIDPSDVGIKISQDSGYHLVESECFQNQIYVYLVIEGKKLRFKLDTGYGGNIIMPASEATKFINNNQMTIQGTFYTTVSSFAVGTDIFYEKMPVHFAGRDFEAKTNVSTSIKAQNIGINFIKGFDWIIDYHKNKIYVKRNANIIENTFNRRITYYAKAEKEKLLISAKELSQRKFNLGDEIISVNGKRVTPENNCEIQDLLNRTEDWNTIDIEIARAAE